MEVNSNIVCAPDVVGMTMSEEPLCNVPKLDKDTLMPKDLSEEKVRVHSPERMSPRSSCSSLRKGLRMVKRSSSKL